ncbi:hypothetical protein HYH38_16215 [Clostridium botulinum]|uniref:Uncharacterized protein n=1 Tax=Clostridium botulinum TaxID=1491 RepID=A0A126JIL0_CLOBO|nr:hypothetical protein [Clostridium botulinum]ALT05438.1 hypothetical protein [Clostridium botulinum]ALT05536.1 hypothetical protein [Clostridium botulinum]ALT05634.1 hypothetical protein [Clostridium botulinum]ALT05734.1 hypothetical protein [Clostridium botulinum]ALT05836.1 hypothetical protein [Clostridium botulinum]
MSEYKYYKGISLTQQYDATVIGLINQNNRVIFMKSTLQIENEGQLLFIDVDTFKKYWRRNNYDEWSKYANASEHELRKDYKFELAESGFSQGEKNPVPVAVISLLKHTIQPCIGFTGGITRTIWLIANGYKIIPFEVRNATSDFLLDKGIYTLKEIIERDIRENMYKKLWGSIRRWTNNYIKS